MQLGVTDISENLREPGVLYWVVAKAGQQNGDILPKAGDHENMCMLVSMVGQGRKGCSSVAEHIALHAKGSRVSPWCFQVRGSLPRFI